MNDGAPDGPTLMDVKSGPRMTSNKAVHPENTLLVSIARVLASNTIYLRYVQLENTPVPSVYTDLGK